MSELDYKKIYSIAGCIAGPLDKTKSFLEEAPNLSDWKNRPLKIELQHSFGTDVLLENDAVLAGIGEAVYGAGKGCNITAYITIGTGVGGARIVNSKLDSNSLGFEPGHQIIVPDGSPCSCGGKGHLEAYISGSSLEGTFNQDAADIQDPDIWSVVTRYLAIGLNNTLVYWSPDVIVLGGAVSKSIPLDKLQTELRSLVTIFNSLPEVKKAILADKAGLYGALEYLKQNRK